jgi:hypothetical protein
MFKTSKTSFICNYCHKRKSTINNYFYRHKANSYKMELCILDSKTHKITVSGTRSLNNKLVIGDFSKNNNFIFCIECISLYCPSIVHNKEQFVAQCRDCDSIVLSDNKIIECKKFNAYICEECLENYCCITDCTRQTGYKCSCCKQYYCYQHGQEHRFDHVSAEGLHVCSNKIR